LASLVPFEALPIPAEGYIGPRNAAFYHPQVRGRVILDGLTGRIVATLIALLAVCVWVAIGSVFQRGRAPGDPLALSLALLTGSGLTAAAFAVLTWLGVVPAAAIGVSVVGAGVLLARRRQVALLVAGALEPYRRALPGMALYWAGVPACALLWLNAVAPPRDADSMRYHLTHVRQIVQDGGWKAIPDYHYALPFGWTLNYLPFELVHAPEAAQLVNAFLLVAMLGAILAILRERQVSPLWTAIVTALVAHPFIVRTFTSANADGYAIFVVFTVCVLLLRADEAHPGDAWALGFVSWIGAQSRYQLVAVAIAALVAILLSRPPKFRALLKPYLAGSALGVLLAAPFYLANLATFGNPVWPLAIFRADASSSYANLIATTYTQALSGSLSPGTIWWGVQRMFTAPELAPLPVAIVLILAASLNSGRRYLNRLVAFGFAFLALWVIAQPRLYPRFVILLLPLAALLAGLRFRTRRAAEAPSNRWSARNLVSLTLAALTLVSAATSLDQIRYAATGNIAAYHRFTWFYPVYAWANRTLPPDARLLVIVYSGHSYYLERQHRRADPWLSAVVDWRRVATGAALDSVLTAGRYDYVIYQDRDWSRFVGGTSLTVAVRQAIGQGSLAPVHSFHVPLYTSRVRRRFEMATVYVLAHSKPGASGILHR
jgi:hypothetical protein